LTERFWDGRRVFVTGHTGFMGGWLCARLKAQGARIWGYSLPAPTEPSLFELAGLEKDFEVSTLGDVRDAGALKSALVAARAEVVFHLAAQPLVRRSFREPAETYSTNVLGTATLLEALRDDQHARAAVVVTSDKCYADDDQGRIHGEDDPLGGSSPYACSKACAELVTSGFRGVYAAAESGVSVATVRAGNVIGGGDWAEDRLVPDIVRAAARNSTAVLRNPAAVRPWQHVLDPLEGYLLLAERMWNDASLACAWNFGPDDAGSTDVMSIAQKLCSSLGVGLDVQSDRSVPETQTLRIDAAKARRALGWRARLGISDAVDWTAQWYRAWLGGAGARQLTLNQIERYQGLAGAA